MFEQYRLNGQVLTLFAYFCIWCDQSWAILSGDTESARWVIVHIDGWHEVSRGRFACPQCYRELEG